MSTSVLAPAAPHRQRGMFLRLLPHLVWEAVLLVAVVLVAVTAAAAEERFFAPILWFQVASVALAATAFALSLRTATPNLAVPVLQVSAASWFIHLVNDGTPVAAATAVVVVACAGIGLLLGVITGLTSVPAWAVSLGAAAIVQGGLVVAYGLLVTPLRERGALLTADGYWFWLVLAGVVSIGGGMLFAVPAVRRLFGANRVSGDVDPAAFRGAKLIGALVGMVGSSAIAGLAGVLFARYTAAATPNVDALLLPVVVGIALLGGVSAFGVRAGIAGTFLAALLFVFVRHWLLLNRAEAGVVFITVGVTVLLGVLVNWLLELVGRAIDRPPAVAVPPPTAPPGSPATTALPGSPATTAAPGSPAPNAPPTQPWSPASPAQPWTPPPGPPAQPWTPPPG